MASSSSPLSSAFSAPQQTACDLPILVAKFGGTSVGDVERIRRVAEIVVNQAKAGYRVVAVVSAMSGVTNHLIELATKAKAHTRSGREYDALLATGEMVTTALLSLAIQDLGYQAMGMNGQQAKIHTEDIPSRARITHIETAPILEALNQGNIVVITGFQGIDSQGSFTTLGRGGSDTSAVAIAGALNATRCDIYTDVRGVYSTDPRMVTEAVKLPEVAHVEMLELARLGAKVLHPRSVETAREFNVPVCVRSTFDLEDKGTMILHENEMSPSEHGIAGVACDLNQARVAAVQVPDTPGVAAKIFQTLAQHNISVDMIIQSVGEDGVSNDIAFTVSTNDVQDAKRLMEQLQPTIGARTIQVNDAIAKVSIVGVGMVDKPGFAAGMFQALAVENINIQMISTSEIKISVLVDRADAPRAVQAIHRQFFPVAHRQGQPEPAMAGVVTNQKLGY
ncbi:MAG: aspartate kinase [Vampirovibrionales bacterium]